MHLICFIHNITIKLIIFLCFYKYIIIKKEKKKGKALQLFYYKDLPTDMMKVECWGIR